MGTPSVSYQPPSPPPRPQTVAQPRARPRPPGTVTASPAITGTATPTATGTPPTSTPTASPTVNVITQGAIVFMSQRSGNKDIWRIKGDGTNPVQLTNNPADDDWPSYSPDYTKILFTSKRDENEEIYVMNADGSGRRALPTTLLATTSPPGRPTDGRSCLYPSAATHRRPLCDECQRHRPDQYHGRPGSRRRAIMGR